MRPTPKPVSSFAGKPLALRRAVLAVLERADQLTVEQIAGWAYRPGRPLCRHRAPVCTASQVESVRRALRALVAKGKVEELPRHRHRKLYRLARRRDVFIQMEALQIE